MREIAARASLVEDGGAEAADAGEFFRSPEFLAAEEATHSLVIEGGDWRQALPLLVRAIPGVGRLDAVSPYGYPGQPVHRPTRPFPIRWTGRRPAS